MNKGALVLPVAIVVVLLLGAGFYIIRPRLAPLFIKQPPATESLISPSPTSADNLPPLYPGIEWGEPEQVEGLIFRTSSGELEMLAGTYLESKAVSTFTDDFFNYYLKELKNRGWVETDSAGGPDGEVYTFEKQNQYFTFRYRVIKDEPGLEGKVTGYKYIMEHN